MSSDIRQLITAVEQAMETLNDAFERHAETLRAGGQQKELQKWLAGAQAIRDSGNIYLSWAQHYAKTTGTGGSQSEDDADLEAFLDEGSDLSGDRPLL